MRILITGSDGFIGRNLTAELNNRQYDEIYGYDKGTDKALLDEYCKKADFVYHLAGVNRPQDETEFMEGNFGFTSVLLNTLKKHGNNCPVMISSSIQAALDNPYGKSKKAGEELIFEYGRETGAEVLVYRFPNVFGKWCRPNYNSVVATFCHNIANDLPIQINDPEAVLNLVYIDDVINELINALHGKQNKTGDYCSVSTTHSVKLGEIAKLIMSFKKSRGTLYIPNMSDAFTSKLYSTYLSYLPMENFSYDLEMKSDLRGSFSEFIKTPDRGQVSINITMPGVTKGNHWHHSKNEKFLAVGGKGVVRLRELNSDKVIEYFVSGEVLKVIDIPPGYTHNIENTGDTELITVIWVNEVFDPEKPDTYFLEV